MTNALPSAARTDRLITSVNPATEEVLATYEPWAPAEISHAASDIHAGAERLDLRVRVGMHTGEVEPVPGNVRGLAVHLASRIVAEAGPGETLVSSTVREMVSADDIIFEDRGDHQLKGVATPRRLFAARIGG